MIFHLRSLRIEDAPLMLEWMKDPTIACFFQFDAASMTVEKCKAFIYSTFLDHKNRNYAIADENDEYLGTISLKNIENGRAEYAISTRKCAHGTGAALCATREILRIAFEELGLDTVYLNVLADNCRANAFYRKAGFKHVEFEENSLVLRGEKKSVNWFEITNELWEKLIKKIPKDQAVPLISCIVLSYNKFEYLFDAVRSVIKQTYPRIELLIADDASDNFDTVKEQLEEMIQIEFHNSLEKYVVKHHEVNVGTVRNINSMLKQSHGDYIFPLSGDDTFFDDGVFVRIINRFLETGYDLLACSRMRCDDKMNSIEIIPNAGDQEKIRLLNSPEKQLRSFATLNFHNIASGSAMYYSKSNFAIMGYMDEMFDIWEDGPRLVEYCKRGKTIPTAYDIVSICYRASGISDMSSGYANANPRMINDELRFIARYILSKEVEIGNTKRRQWALRYNWYMTEKKIHRLLILLKYPDAAIALVLKRVLRN